MINWFRHLPHRCPLCLAPADAYMCAGCEKDLPELGNACCTCALPLEQNALRCGDCLQNPKPFTTTICAFRYEAPLDTLIHYFKSRDPAPLSCALSTYLLNRLSREYSPQNWPDVLVPVPVHWRTRWQRGFNQTEHLARHLARPLQRPVACAVARRKRSAAQKSLNRKLRLVNLKGAFRCQQNVSGLHVAVIDDVVTTGGTVIRMSECLLRAGAKRVDIWALARTPRPHG